MSTVHLPTHELFSILAAYYDREAAKPGASAGALARAVAVRATCTQLAELTRGGGMQSPGPLHRAMMLLHYDYQTDPDTGHADKARSFTLREWAEIVQADLDRRAGERLPSQRCAITKADVLGMTSEERCAAAADLRTIASAIEQHLEQDDRTAAMVERYRLEANRLASGAGLSDLLDRLAVTDPTALELLARVHACPRYSVDYSVTLRPQEVEAAKRLIDQGIVALLELASDPDGDSTKPLAVTITGAGVRLIEEIGVARRLLPDGQQAWIPLEQHKAIWKVWRHWVPRLTARGLEIYTVDADEEHSGLEYELRTVYNPLHEGVRIEVDVFGNTSVDAEQFAGDPDMAPDELAGLVRDCMHVGVEQLEVVRKAIARIVVAPFTAASLAEALYAAYTESSGGLNWQGKKRPSWAELPAEIRGHWGAAAKGAKLLLAGPDAD